MTHYLCWINAVKDVEGYRVEFTKNDLSALDDGELKIISVFPHIANRLLMLESQVYAHENVAVDETQDLITREAAICSFFESVYLIAGELKEGWEALQQCYYRTKVSRVMNGTLPQEIQDCLKRIPRYFSGDSLATFLRNNFAYHNSPDVALQTVKDVVDDESFTFYYLDGQLFFNYAASIRAATLAKRLNVADWIELIPPLKEYVIGQMYNDVCVPLTVIAHEIIMRKVKHRKEPVTLKNVAGTKQIRAGVFMHHD